MSLNAAAAALDKLIAGNFIDGQLKTEKSTREHELCISESQNMNTDSNPDTIWGSNRQLASDFSRRPDAAGNDWSLGELRSSLMCSSCLSISSSPQSVTSDPWCGFHQIPKPISFAFSHVNNNARDDQGRSPPTLFGLPRMPLSVVNHYELPINNIQLSNVAPAEDCSPLDSSKFKTELCRSYQVLGVCKYGVRCNYAHGLNQLKVSFRHGKYKTRNCQSYHETGFCRYGARCSFIHDPEEGILKCPITEREVLEALHYRPMSEFHHYATMTWRVCGSNLGPPTELYFFSPPPELVTECQVTSVLTEYETDISSPSSLDTSSDFSASVSGKCETVDEDLETRANGECLSQESDVANSASSPGSSFSSNLHELTVETTEDDFIENYFNPHPHSERDSMVKYNGTHPRKISHPNSQKQSLPKNLSHNSNSIKSFKLDDFLRCLKTKEGQHHLAPWSCEVEEKCSSLRSSSVNPRRSCETASKEHMAKVAKDYSKYKTELCRSFQYNQFCEYGQACLYAHGRKDMMSYPKHPMYRSKKCFSFHQKGFCLYGSRCQFLHDVEYSLSR